MVFILIVISIIVLGLVAVASFYIIIAYSHKDESEFGSSLLVRIVAVI